MAHPVLEATERVVEESVTSVLQVLATLPQTVAKQLFATLKMAPVLQEQP